MAVLPIRIVGDPVLRTPSEPVTEFGPELARLVRDMEETMLDVEGAGLAAPQVGVSLRLFTYAVDGRRGHVVNPVLEVGDALQTDGSEGCLSVPGLGYRTVRAEWARVRGVDVDGVPVEVEGTGLLARCLQHETDHLDGKLYIDGLEGPERKDALRRIRAGQFNQVAESTQASRARSVGSVFGASLGHGSVGHRTDGGAR
ncbi:peptide deformylase [Zhihengliuella sp.]|uniref:peptide deformylase n=1 Tax=Zhihengliuella sp. TaxID=1954483 RepID=UPI002810E1CB|nr:peptide deformylase [Zhihengliuella sp.]